MRIVTLIAYAAAVMLAPLPAVQADEQARRAVVEQTTIVMCPPGGRQIDCTPKVARLVIVCAEHVVFAPCPHWSERSTESPIQWSAQFSERGFGGARVVVVRTTVSWAAFNPHDRLAAFSQ